jgi:hypothetical protein
LSGSGSGFVVSVDGNSALIVTNHHVVEPTILAQTQKDSKVILVARPPTRIMRPPMTATFPRPYVRPLPPGFTPRLIVHTLKNAAVTVVFDSGTKDERFAKAETMAVYTFGFPFGKMLATGKGRPSVIRSAFGK